MRRLSLEFIRTFLYAKTEHNRICSFAGYNVVASLMSLTASLVTTSRIQQYFYVLTDIYHEFLLLFHYCFLFEIKLTTSSFTKTRPNAQRKRKHIGRPLSNTYLTACVEDTTRTSALLCRQITIMKTQMHVATIHVHLEMLVKVDKNIRRFSDVGNVDNNISM